MAVVLFVSIRNSSAQVGVLETMRLRTLKVLNYSFANYWRNDNTIGMSSFEQAY